MNRYIFRPFPTLCPTRDSACPESLGQVRETMAKPGVSPSLPAHGWTDGWDICVRVCGCAGGRALGGGLLTTATPHSLPLPVSCRQLLWACGHCSRLLQKVRTLGLLAPCLGPQPACPPHVFPTDSPAPRAQGFSSEAGQGTQLGSEVPCVTYRLWGLQLSADLWSTFQDLSLPGYSVTALLSLWICLIHRMGRANQPPRRLCRCPPRLIRK